MTEADRRKEYEKGLSSLYLPYYQALCDCLPEEWQPYFGIRTIELQDALYAKGRTAPGNIVTKAQGGASAHNYGCATDWTIFNNGNPLWLLKDDPKWQVYKDACGKVGVTWGGDFCSLTDLYHNELTISVSWSEVKKVLDQDGLDAAMAFISKVMVK